MLHYPDVGGVRMPVNHQVLRAMLPALIATFVAMVAVSGLTAAAVRIVSPPAAPATEQPTPPSSAPSSSAPRRSGGPGQPSSAPSASQPPGPVPTLPVPTPVPTHLPTPVPTATPLPTHLPTPTISCLPPPLPRNCVSLPAVAHGP